ncbi:hypothetical protein AAFN88_00465 [Pelagibius sp. CAU 1746]|uniref:hypothetical protein n=1 Tax=Pelagibius sp. CAU 1746 TaxID=3140370 RepID=UPI00325BBB75
MRAKAASAALALLFPVVFAGPAGAASPLAEDQQATARAQIAHITTEGFEAMLAASVEDQGGIETEEGDTLRVELRDEAKVLFFTRPGHRAHPGVVEVRIVEEENGPGVDTAGWWAGDGQAFEAWFRVFKRRNDRLRRQWQMEAGPF